MRTLSGPAAAVIAQPGFPIMLLVEMDLTSPIAFNTSGIDFVISGTTYYGTHGIGKIGAVADTPAEVKGLTFELAGVASDRISLALTEPLQGKAVRIKTAVVDPSTYTVLDVRLRWAGWLDVMTISDDAKSGTATISVSAEHGGIDLARPYTSLYSDEEQQRLHSGDLFLQFMADQVEQRIVWPAAAFFKH